MRSLLDSILDNSQGARVVSEQHDAGKINVTNGISGGGGWDAAEYGVTAAQAQAMLAAADTDEARERVLTNLRSRAMRRAQLDMSGGRVRAMFAKQPAWHGLGVVVDKAATSAEAIRYAGLDWRVAKIPLSYQWDGRTVESKEAFAIVREDTGDCLGTVGSRYAPVQNVDGFAFLDGVLEEFGAKYETAGSLYDGSRVWMLAHMPERRFEVAPGDVTEPYVMFSNCHDGSGSAWCFPTTVRVECANTYRVAAGKADRVMKIRHTGSVKTKINDARQSLGLAVRSIDTYRESAEAMVHATCDVGRYAHAVLDCALEITEAQAKQGAASLAAVLAVTKAEADLAQKRFQAQIDDRRSILEDILNRHESERCQPRGSVWAAFNAVTEHADHGPKSRQAKDIQTRRSRRFESVLTGEADQMKQVAYEQAIALAR